MNALYVDHNLYFHLNRKDKYTVCQIFNPGNFFDEVVIIDQSGYGKSRLSDNIMIYSITDTKKILFKPINLWRKKNFIKKIAKEHNIDLLIQLFGSPFDTSLPLVMASRETSIPCIITTQNEYLELFRDEHPLLFKTGIIQSLYNYILKGAKGIRLVSKHLIGEIPEHLRYKCEYIPRKENLSFLRKIRGKNKNEKNKNKKSDRDMDPEPDRELVYLTVSKLKKQKNLKNAVIAFGRSLKKNNNMRFIIVGSGNLKDELIDLIKKMQLTSKVEIIDGIKREDLLQLYANSDVFLFPSRYEGRPRALFEAIFYKLPIICLDIPSTEGMVNDGVNGIRVETGSIEGIEKAINDMGNARLRKKLSKGNSFYDVEEFSIDNVNKKEIEFYSGIINKTKNL